MVQERQAPELATCQALALPLPAVYSIDMIIDSINSKVWTSQRLIDR